MSDQLFESDDAPAAGEADVGAPLAVRMRPRSLEDLVGQEHLLASGSTLRYRYDSAYPPAVMLTPRSQRCVFFSKTIQTVKKRRRHVTSSFSMR